MFFQVLYNITDTFYAGWISTAAQAALAFSFPLFFILLSCCVGAGQAVTARAAHAVGGGHFARARFFFAQGMVTLRRNRGLPNPNLRPPRNPDAFPLGRERTPNSRMRRRTPASSTSAPRSS